MIRTPKRRVPKKHDSLHHSAQQTTLPQFPNILKVKIRKSKYTDIKCRKLVFALATDFKADPLGNCVKKHINMSILEKWVQKRRTAFSKNQQLLNFFLIFLKNTGSIDCYLISHLGGIFLTEV